MKSNNYETGLNMLKVIGVLEKEAESPFYEQLKIRDVTNETYALINYLIRYMGYEKDSKDLITFIYDEEYWENEEYIKNKEQPLNPYVSHLFINIKKINEKEFYKHH